MEIGVYAMELMPTTPECLSVSQEEQFRKWKVLLDKLALTSEALIPHSIWLTAPWPSPGNDGGQQRLSPFMNAPAWAPNAQLCICADEVGALTTPRAGYPKRVDERNETAMQRTLVQTFKKNVMTTATLGEANTNMDIRF